MDMDPIDLKIKRDGAERHLLWFLIAALVSIFLCGFVYAISAGLFAAIDPIMLGNNVRGYTIIGIALGILAVVLIALASIYTMRKRMLQEKDIPFKGTMVSWLWAHVYLGLLSLLVAALHAGLGAVSFSISAGKILFVVFIVLVLSGIAWRLVYHFVPPYAANKIRNYSKTDSLEQAQKFLVEIEKLSAGRSDRFKEVKNLIVEDRNTDDEVRAALTELGAKDREVLAEIQKLAARRSRALNRSGLQDLYHFILQSWRALHIPFAVLFVGFFILHLITAFDIPSRIFPAQFEGFPPAKECAECHAAITEQWENSMHAHAVTSPVTIVQTNQVVAKTIAGQASPDPYLICNNCHAPVGTMLTGQGTLPLVAPFPMSDEVINEGVNCATCHQYHGEPASGAGGLASVFQEDLKPGGWFYGTLADPVANAYHRSANDAPMWENPESICQSCHNVNYDKNNDGVIKKGEDLILQTTYDEYLAYREAGGPFSCLDCHMPVLNQDRNAEAAVIPFQQDRTAPAREVADHSFVGVDYPLDTVAESDPQKDAREALLQSAATIFVNPDQTTVDPRTREVRFSVEVANVGAGHQLPTGFAFARQMWLEIVVRDNSGTLLYSSGVLASNVDDLCDEGTMTDALARYMVGCPDGSDPQLVNFQQKLLNIIDVAEDEDGEITIVQGEDGEEAFLQHLTSGSSARIRPVDGQELTRIDPFEKRSFSFSFIVDSELPDEIQVSVRLLFRNLPPYFLRALAANQSADEIPQLAPLIGNLQIVEMAAQNFLLELK